MIDHEEHATDEQAPDDTMNDTESESEGREISTGGALADPMQQVCLLLLLRVSHCPHFRVVCGTNFRKVAFSKICTSVTSMLHWY